MGQPHEIVPLVCLLLSGDASYITGQDYLVDGGYTLV
jgi:NAD(P)-dependent dehydrogenase (short-subunit alcohol dehydrogenase family)